MAHTGHGHHIPGTSGSDFRPKDVIDCGGIKICPRCKSEVENTISLAPQIRSTRLTDLTA